MFLPPKPVKPSSQVYHPQGYQTGGIVNVPQEDVFTTKTTNGLSKVFVPKQPGVGGVTDYEKSFFRRRPFDRKAKPVKAKKGGIIDWDQFGHRIPEDNLRKREMEKFRRQLNETK